MAGKVTVFNCPNCGSSVTLRAQGQSLVVTCVSCGSIIDVTNENYQIISKYTVHAKIKPVIPLGTRGEYKGDKWEAIGFVQRSVGIYSWSEYLLYNPFKGFRWLTEYDGHWNFVTMIKDRPQPDKAGNVRYLENDYSLFQTGTAKVEYVIGEFYWRVKVGETVAYSDYIAPPRILSVEGGENELVWSHGEYVEPETVNRMFNLTEELPFRMGIGACQPFPYGDILFSLWQVGLLFVAFLFVIHLSSWNRIFWNFLICSVLILLPPFFMSLYKSSFEKKRWGEGSDLTGEGDD